MAFQEFETADVARLEIERDPVGAELLNLVPNPDGAGGETYGLDRRVGGWGWLAPLTGVTVDADASTGTPYLRMFLTAGVDNYIDTEPVLLTPSSSAYVTATYRQSMLSGEYSCGQLRFFNASGALVGEGQRGPATTSPTVGSAPITAVPVGTVYVALRLWVGIGAAQAVPTSGGAAKFTDVTVVGTATQPILSNVTRTNLCTNPGAEVNVTGWTANGGTVARSTNVPRHGAGRFGVTKTATTVSLEASRAATAGLAYTVSAWVVQGTSGGTARMLLRWKNASNVVIGSTVFGSNVTLTADLLRATLTATAPAGTATVEYGVQYNGGLSSGNVFVDSFLLEQAAGVSSYIEGTVTHPTAAFPATPSVYWQDVTEDLEGAVTTNRKVGDVGTLTASITSAALDPATGSTVLRPGRQVRLSALADGVWVSLFRGKLRPGRTDYELLNEVNARTRIAINAVDAWAALAGKKITAGVGLIQWLPAKFEGLGVPWRCSTVGSGQSAWNNDHFDLSGTVQDNVMIARDLKNGYAWVNAYGVVNVWERNLWAAVDPATVAITEDDYNGDLGAAYDQTDLINSVKVVVLDGATSTEYGPYEDAASIQRNGGEVYPATFTVAPDNVPLFNPATYAAGVLASNTDPEVTIETLTIPLHTQDRVDAWAAVDLEHLAAVSNTELSYAEDNRVASVSHVIDPGSSVLEAKWLLTLTFHRPDRAPIPTKAG